jgi:UDP-sulfoquinovose synthase
MTEAHRLVDLARLVSRLTGAPIDFVANPRNEAPENDLTAENRHLLELGLEPITLREELLREVTDIARRYSHRCDRDKIPCRSRWVATSGEETAKGTVPAGAERESVDDLAPARATS